MEKKLITASSLEKLIPLLREEGKIVFAPVASNNIVDFAEINTLKEMAVDYIVTAQSAKNVAFPRVETVFNIETSKDGITLTDKDIEAIPEIVLFGTRPCDAAGFEGLNAIFTWDYVDSIFATRLKRTTIISISCAKCDNKCFCTSVNVDPGGTKGSDILLTKIENDSYLAEIVSEKGQALAKKYAHLFQESAETDKSKYVVSVPTAFELQPVLDSIGKNFENELWVEQSLRCIGCGACAYVCPTCACFDIQDVTNTKVGSRKRSWDSCGFSLFTLHTSGHNPREVQSARWRQRVMHKFAYMPLRQQVVGCEGCGRCSRACPVDMNLKEHMINISEEVTK